MARLQPGEGYAERRARRKLSRHRHRRKQRTMTLAGIGHARHGTVVQSLRVGRLPLPGLKQIKQMAHYGITPPAA